MSIVDSYEMLRLALKPFQHDAMMEPTSQDRSRLNEAVETLGEHIVSNSAPLVIVESPYRGTGSNRLARWFNRSANERYARNATRDCFMRGEIPFASHLLYPDVLDDNNDHERTLGIHAGFAWARYAQTTVVYIDRGISDGMRSGVLDAIKHGRRVFYRSLTATPPKMTQL